MSRWQVRSVRTLWSVDRIPRRQRFRFDRSVMRHWGRGRRGRTAWDAQLRNPEIVDQLKMNVDVLKNWPNSALFAYFRPIMTNLVQNLTTEAWMVCLGFTPGTTNGWRIQIHWAMPAPTTHLSNFIPYLNINLKVRSSVQRCNRFTAKAEDNWLINSPNWSTHANLLDWSNANCSNVKLQAETT